MEIRGLVLLGNKRWGSGAFGFKQRTLRGGFAFWNTGWDAFMDGFHILPPQMSVDWHQMRGGHIGS